MRLPPTPASPPPSQDTSETRHAVMWLAIEASPHAAAMASRPQEDSSAAYSPPGLGGIPPAISGPLPRLPHHPHHHHHRPALAAHPFQQFHPLQPIPPQQHNAAFSYDHYTGTEAFSPHPAAQHFGQHHPRHSPHHNTNPHLPQMAHNDRSGYSRQQPRPPRPALQQQQPQGAGAANGGVGAASTGVQVIGREATPPQQQQSSRGGLVAVGRVADPQQQRRGSGIRLEIIGREANPQQEQQAAGPGLQVFARESTPQQQQHRLGVLVIGRGADPQQQQQQQSTGQATAAPNSARAAGARGPGHAHPPGLGAHGQHHAPRPANGESSSAGGAAGAAGGSLARDWGSGRRGGRPPQNHRFQHRPAPAAAAAAAHGSQSLSSQPLPPLTSSEDFPPLGTARPQTNSGSPSPAPSSPVLRPLSPAQHSAPSSALDISKPRMATEQVDQSPQSWRPRKNIPTQNQQRCRGPNRGNVFRYPQHMPNARQMVAVRKLVQEQVALATMPPDEIERKRRCHERLQKVCQTVRPTAELVPFGSLVSGFAVVGSDLDLVLSDPSEPADGLQGFQIPILIEKALQADGMKTQLLTKTRVPILKVTQPATPDCPEAIAADIGFSNELAICNTQMLRTYSKCDSRVVDMVKFVKRWAKLRKINSAYKGTLSSYGYVLMVLHYLINIVEPPVLPNLQLHPVPLDTPKSEVESHGRNVWFYKDVDALEQSARNRKPSDNHMNVAELLLGLYDYYSYEFSWVKSVISLRTPGGLLTKIEKGWTSAKIKARDMETSYKDRYLFAIEDPFETTHNVSRTCTYNGVYLMRDEFKRAHQLLRCREGEEKLPTLFEEAPDHKWGQGPPRAVVPLPESDDPELLDMIIKKYYSNPKPTD